MEKEELIQGLISAGCSEAAAVRIGSLYASGSRAEALRQMKKQRCERVEEMHESQRKVDRMDYLIRSQSEKQGKRK